jgi:hypothetical protein
MITHDKLRAFFNQLGNFLQRAQQQIHDSPTNLTPNMMMMLSSFFQFIPGLAFLKKIQLNDKA